MIHKLYINGKWISSTSKKTFPSYNPATNKIMGHFQAGNEKDVNKAVEAATKALPSWKATPAPKRAEYLFQIRDLLIKNKEDLARCMTQEMGKVLSEAKGDVQEAIDCFEYMAGEGRRLFGHTTPSELKNKFCMTTRIPLGVCALITPWNFPIAIPAWKISAALITGNTIILKPSSDTPLMATKLFHLFKHLPKGIVNLVTGSGREVGSKLVKHKDIQGISFTGSRNTGKFILKNAGLKKVGLELGGKNGIIVMDDANLDLAVDGILWGGFGTTGQRCTATSRVIAHKKIKKKLERKLIKRIKKLKLGNGLKKQTDIGPLINKKAVEKTKKYLEIGKKEGAKLLCGGTFENNFFQPTLFTNAKKNFKIAQEEIFGPVVTIIPIKNLDEAIQTINSISYGLSSSIYTNNMTNAFKAIEQIESGITYINASTIGAEVHLPFGGIKETGNTREAGIEGINEFSHTKTIYIDYSNKLQKAQGID